MQMVMATISSSIMTKPTSAVPALTLIMMTLMLMTTDPSNPHYFLTMNDGLSNTLMALSTMTTILILTSSSTKKTWPLIVSINTILIPTFLTSNLITFYILFELSIIPTFMLVTLEGKQPERLQASLYLILYTITASLPLLISLLMIQSSPNMHILSTTMTQFYIPLTLTLAFLVKSPLFLLHLWLPKAHVEAPLEGSMILAAILLKLGGYGLLRLYPLMTKSLSSMSPWIVSTALMGSLATSMMCMRQKDLKAIIAYSSVAHMSLITAGVFTKNQPGQQGALMTMVAHAFASSALFLLTTLTYEPFSSRNTSLFKGALWYTPNLTMWWFLFTAANMATPPFLNLLGEILTITSLLQWSLSTIPIMAMASMALTSFSVIVYSTISHNSPNPLPTNLLIPSKQLTSLLTHMFPLLLIMMKPEMMSI